MPPDRGEQGHPQLSWAPVSVSTQDFDRRSRRGESSHGGRRGQSRGQGTRRGSAPFTLGLGGGRGERRGSHLGGLVEPDWGSLGRTTGRGSFRSLAAALEDRKSQSAQDRAGTPWLGLGRWALLTHICQVLRTWGGQGLKENIQAPGCGQQGQPSSRGKVVFRGRFHFCQGPVWMPQGGLSCQGDSGRS